MMVAPVRVSMGSGRYGITGDEDYTLTTWYGGPGKPALLMHHGRGSTALSNYQDVNYANLFRELAEEYTVCIHDCNSNVNWGNQAAVNSIGSVFNFLKTEFGVAGTKYGMLAVSMGSAMTHTRLKQFPSEVAVIAGIVPLMSIRDLQTYQSGTNSNDGVTAGVYSAEINTAYGGTYSDATHGVNYSPYIYRASIPRPAGIRIGHWYSRGDMVVRPQFEEAVVAAQPWIELFDVRAPNGSGGYLSPDHGPAALSAMNGLQRVSVSEPGFPRVADWLFERKLDVSFA